jgi:hypothetical protein
MERLCLDCQAILNGRADKKFCDDQCRTNYNNRIRAEDNSYLNEVNRILKKNRDILRQQNPDGKVKIKKAILVRKGFDFNYHTHTYATQKGTTYVFCYEYGYLTLENEEILLVKREEK